MAARHFWISFVVLYGFPAALCLIWSGRELFLWLLFELSLLVSYLFVRIAAYKTKPTFQTLDVLKDSPSSIRPTYYMSNRGMAVLTFVLALTVWYIFKTLKERLPWWFGYALDFVVLGATSAGKYIALSYVASRPMPSDQPKPASKRWY
jgi:hypothetical protein